jgi:hypothetical protein
MVWCSVKSTGTTLPFYLTIFFSVSWPFTHLTCTIYEDSCLYLRGIYTECMLNMLIVRLFHDCNRRVSSIEWVRVGWLWMMNLGERKWSWPILRNRPTNFLPEPRRRRRRLPGNRYLDGVRVWYVSHTSDASYCCDNRLGVTEVRTTRQLLREIDDVDVKLRSCGLWRRVVLW